MANFPIYLPWHPARTNFATKHASTDLLMLDVQLGSACNAKCPRCDTACSDLREPADLDIGALCALAQQINQRTVDLNIVELSGGRNMGFICGLGEPTVGNNLLKLQEILQSTEESNFSWSLFTNGISWPCDYDTFLKKGRLNMMVQYNSRNLDLLAKMFGSDEYLAGIHLDCRKKFQKWARCLNKQHIERTGTNLTNIAASIVPDHDNLCEIIDILGECKQYGIFPLIGELEDAGHAKGDYYEAHKLHDQVGLAALRQEIEYSFGIKYEIPICPAAIGAIHINNRNIVTVDEFTGLSCGWFGMGDPKVHIIGDFREMSYAEIVSAILKYRESRIPEVRKAINSYPEQVFGGCGGNAHNLLKHYLSIYD